MRFSILSCLIYGAAVAHSLTISYSSTPKGPQPEGTALADADSLFPRADSKPCPVQLEIVKQNVKRATGGKKGKDETPAKACPFNPGGSEPSPTPKAAKPTPLPKTKKSTTKKSTKKTKAKKTKAKKTKATKPKAKKTKAKKKPAKKPVKKPAKKPKKGGRLARSVDNRSPQLEEIKTFTWAAGDRAISRTVGSCASIAIYNNKTIVWAHITSPIESTSDAVGGALGRIEQEARRSGLLGHVGTQGLYVLSDSKNMQSSLNFWYRSVGIKAQQLSTDAASSAPKEIVMDRSGSTAWPPAVTFSDRKNVEAHSLVARQCGPPKGKKIIMVGLSEAGKSTILRIINGKPVKPAPAAGVDAVDTAGKMGQMQIWNLKGTSVGSNGAGARGVIFVIDSADRSRAAEAKAAFKKIEADRTLKALPMLVIANKQDIPTAMTPQEISQSLGLNSAMDRVSYVTPASAGYGVAEGMVWMNSMIR